MNAATAAKLSDTGTLVAAAGEITYRSQPDVDLYDGDAKRRRGGVAMLTSHRIAYLNPGALSGASAAAAAPADGAPHHLEWHLSQVVRWHTEAAGLFAGSAKIVVELTKQPTAGTGSASPAIVGAIKLSFKHAGHAEFVDHLGKALARKEWAVAALPPPAAAAAPVVTAAAVAARPGLDFLRAHAEEKARKQEALTSEAFEDLAHLEALAKPLVALAERYAAEAKRKAAAAAAAGSGAGGAGGGEAGDGAASADVAALMVSMGMVDPVTRESAGRAFHEQVARQLATVLRPVLERAGGLMTLTDVYCAYNRARVTELIAPNDLLDAAKLLAPLGLGCHLRRFDSGLLAIQLDSFSDDGAVARIVALLRERVPAVAAGGRSGAVSLADDPFLSAYQLAAAWKVPLPIAQQHLALAEARGAVCRDDSVNGLRYYLNRFAEAG